MISKKNIVLFGDESIGTKTVTYACVAVEETEINAIERRFDSIKISFGGKIGDEIHCSKFINKNSRAKSPWSHLDETQWIHLLEKVADLVRNSAFGCSLGILERELVPDFIKGPFDSFQIALKEKHLAVHAFGLSVSQFIHLKPVPKVLVDPDRTKIKWAHSEKQAHNLYRFEVELNGEMFEVIGLPADKMRNPIIQIADILAYASMRSNCTGPFRNDFLRIANSFRAKTRKLQWCQDHFDAKTQTPQNK